MPSEEIRLRTTGGIISVPPGRPLEECIASAERIRSRLMLQVDEARERLNEAESRASTPPELLRRLGGIVAEAERRVEHGRAPAADTLAVPPGSPRQP